MWVQITARGLAAFSLAKSASSKTSPTRSTPSAALRSEWMTFDSARLQGAENQLVDVGLLDLAEMLGRGTEIEERRQLFRAEFGQREAQPFGIAEHHMGWRAARAGTERLLQGRLSRVRSP